MRTTIGRIAAGAVLCAALIPPAAPGGEPFRFAVLGDSQPHSAYALPNKVYGEILERINRLSPEFVVSVGDVVCGTSDPTTFRRQVKDFINSSKALAMPYYICFGNHDMFHPEILKEMIGPLYFSFSHKGAHFILLNTNLPGQTAKIAGEQLEWLKDDLARNAGAGPLFVFLHRPVFPARPWEDNMAGEEQEKLHALFRAHGVAAVFSGHQHLHHVEERDGIRYCISGGAGGELHVGDPDSFYHFLMVSVCGGGCRIETHKMVDRAAEVFNGLVVMESPFVMRPLPGEDAAPGDGLAAAPPDPGDSSRAGVFFARGFAFLEAGQEAQALAACDAALAADPGHAGALIAKAIVLARRGGDRDAEAMLREVVRRPGAPEEARFNLGLLLLRGGRAADALAVMEEGTASSPRAALLAIGAGIVRARMKDHAGARAAFEKAVSSPPHAARARLELARLLAGLGDYAGASDACRPAPGGYPSDGASLSLMADACARTGNIGEARRCCELLIESDPGDAGAHIRKGNLLLSVGDNDAALAEYRSALALKRDSAAALFNTAMAAIRKDLAQMESYRNFNRSREKFEDLPEILSMFKAVLALRIGDDVRAKALNNLAATLYLGGLAELPAIEEYLRMAIAADPALPEPHVNLGNICWETKCTGQAGLSYLKALRLDPACSAARYNLATLLALDGKMDEGIEVYRELLARDPSFVNGWNSLAEAYLYRHARDPGRTGDLALAVEAWRRSIAARPNQHLPKVMIEKVGKEHPGLAGGAGQR